MQTARVASRAPEPEPTVLVRQCELVLHTLTSCAASAPSVAAHLSVAHAVQDGVRAGLLALQLQAAQSQQLCGALTHAVTALQAEADALQRRLRIAAVTLPPPRERADAAVQAAEAAVAAAALAQTLEVNEHGGEAAEETEDETESEALLVRAPGSGPDVDEAAEDADSDEDEFGYEDDVASAEAGN